MATQTIPVEVTEPKDTEKTTARMIPIHILGRRYMVPDDLTIMKAMEYAGYQITRGCGCRGGICGACATVYRLPDSHRIEVGLACQTIVEPDMFLAQLPFFPQNKAVYQLEELTPEGGTLSREYPEIFKCIGCGTCTRSCPQDIEVMDYMAMAIRGDIQRVAELSFDCVMCGLCTVRCPAEEAQPLVAILARRLYSRYVAPRAEHLKKRVKQIEDGRYDESLKELMEASVDTLKELYTGREKEPDLPDPDWRPKDSKYL